MSTCTEPNYEFRCNRCWHPNTRSTSDAGREVDCQLCGATIIAPEATEDRISRAATSLPTTESVANHSSDKLSSDVAQSNTDPTKSGLDEPQHANSPETPSRRDIPIQGSSLNALVIDFAACLLSIAAGSILLVVLDYLGILSAREMLAKPISFSALPSWLAMLMPFVSVLEIEGFLWIRRRQTIGSFLTQRQPSANHFSN
ncbi:MAG: hypothetical protein KDB03_16095 [Planctomycetales bacterium]|nr:hypothetical protein [Planctomycetales bacterium]